VGPAPRRPKVLRRYQRPAPLALFDSAGK
jgi:hypothetical protein